MGGHGRPHQASWGTIRGEFQDSGSDQFRHDLTPQAVEDKEPEVRKSYPCRVLSCPLLSTTAVHPPTPSSAALHNKDDTLSLPDF
jgi:hypothetical protein